MIKYISKVINENKFQNNFSSYALGVDLGGTNTNIAIAGVQNNRPDLLLTLHFKSQELKSILPAIEETLSYVYEKYHIKPNSACIGAAGVVSHNGDSADLTNISWNLDIKEIIENTSLTSAFIINDFQAIGYGVNLLDLNNENDILQVKSIQNQNVINKRTKAVIGAGTGLGKSILTYDNNINAHIPIPSEGGHSDFTLQNEFELQLTDYIKKQRNIIQPISYEELLSGRGIEGIYLFLKKQGMFDKTQYTNKIDSVSEKAALISRYKAVDKTCNETFKLFARFYSRCAKNFALDTMATGGLYIAGGIAVKNKEIFQSKEFIDEFENAYQRIDVLKQIPIYIIVNYDVGLYGACFAAIHKNYLINRGNR